MQLVLQRVRQASISIENKEVAHIGPGVVVFVGFTANDESRELAHMAQTLVHLRLFDDETGRLNRSLIETHGECLIVCRTSPSWPR